MSSTDMTAKSDDRVRELASSVWRSKVRPYMPEKQGLFNDVIVPDFKLGDYRITSETPVRPDYEEHLVSLVKSYVSEEDTVCVIGGGYGVSTVHALRKTGEGGEAIVFEASIEMLEKCRKTLQESRFTDWQLKHGLFYEGRDVWGSYSEAKVLDALDIPRCDTLILDCEGVEYQIIKDLENFPKTVIVETHGAKNSPASKNVKMLENHGYEIKAVKPMEGSTDVVAAKRRGDGL